MLDETITGETMVLCYQQNQKQTKISLLQNQIFTSNLGQLLCNALVQQHFHHTCSTWYLKLTQKLKN